ncbi:hypothetical protein PILCRDRAFT_823442 [Piloderma croceum F 1598]|uniref:Uncharacterized protein n=1 Tax=Piloderma croceum (strain F 1598) TaxID=765440 RepID=A0A0C3FIE9_PILCF|nr:hypothetical protein PILCRDRAFT_823442 [Piloderma croceum F 1598]
MSSYGAYILKFMVRICLIANDGQGLTPQPEIPSRCVHTPPQVCKPTFLSRDPCKP